MVRGHCKTGRTAPVLQYLFKSFEYFFMGLLVYFKKKFTRKSPASTRLSSRTSGIEADDVLFGAKSQVLLQESGKTILAGWPSRAI